MPVKREEVEAGRMENARARSAGTAPATPTVRNSVTLTLPEPPSANRWWRRSGTRMHLSSAAKKYKAAVGQLAGTLPCYGGPVRLVVIWHRGRKSGDLDKRLGVMLDALQGVLYENDSQIIEIHARRFDTPRKPQVIVTVTEAA